MPVETFDKADGPLGPVLSWTDAVVGLEVVSQEAVDVAYPSAGAAFATTEFGDAQTVTLTFTQATMVAGPLFSIYARQTLTDLSLDSAGVYLDVHGAGHEPTQCAYELYNLLVGGDTGDMNITTVGTAPGPGSVLSLIITADNEFSIVLDDETILAATSEPTVNSGPFVGFALYEAAETVALGSLGINASEDLGTMFLPPSFGRIPTTVPKGFPQYDGVTNALMRNYRPRQEGTNVYYTSEGEVTETDPDSVNLFWDKTQGTPYVVYTFWGSTDAPYEVTTAQAQALSDAGYTLT